jgi:hypothetical protein
LNLVLINAVKEQQAEIENLQNLVDALKNLVCTDHPGSDLCR